MADLAWGQSNMNATEMPSVLLDYKLTAKVKGNWTGLAQLEWQLENVATSEATPYQLQLNMQVGPKLMQLIQRKTRSAGVLGAQGLVPQRYDEDVKVITQSPKKSTVLMEPDFVTLANAKRLKTPLGVQDATSQFMQLTWALSQQVGRQARPVSAGQKLAFPVALPRGIDIWRYEVLGSEKVETPFGPVDAWHLRPTLEKGSDYSAEAWLAPSMHYLPVRIQIRQDADTFIDMTLANLPKLLPKPLPSSPVARKAASSTN